MTLGHSIFIIVLTLGNILGALWLLWWTRRSHDGADAGALTTGHTWDGDLQELNNPLPRWWLWLFIITVAFGGGYLLLYPGLGSWQGTLHWTSRAEHAADAAENSLRIEKSLARFAQREVPDLMLDSGALGVGRNLFLNNCAACHGSDGGGAPGFPNLTDKDWLWGGDPESVVATISDGRVGVMPPWGEVLGQGGVENVLHYVFSLQGRELPAGNAGAGGAKFAELCVACHGGEGRGIAAMGTPNLTDDIWLNGGAIATVRESIEKGRTATMPAHGVRLGQTRVRLLAAYVLSLSTPVATAQVADESAAH
jgi:cytochrome c oxidase cbb3-type subunit 3